MELKALIYSRSGGGALLVTAQTITESYPIVKKRRWHKPFMEWVIVGPKH
jgi:hypothetical protein